MGCWGQNWELKTKQKKRSPVVAACPSRWPLGVAAGSRLSGGGGAGGGRTMGTAFVPGLLGAPGTPAYSGVGGRRLGGGGRSEVEGRGTLGTAAPVFRNGSRRAPWGPGSRRGSGRGRRTSNIRTRGEEAAVPVGRGRKAWLPPDRLVPSRSKSSRELLPRWTVQFLEFGSGR
jgi:hypothetical protein